FPGLNCLKGKTEFCATMASVWWYVGHREADLAMTELFGGFSPAFYSTYRSIAHVDAGYDERRDLYNLYHLLNHVNLFGYSYVGSVLHILNRFGG
ncbi:MAG: fructosamine kinase family protein, partial [Clostridia bacterium]|nr:fructosamine kinase family protein [Clostridia bacterium]